MLLCSHCFSKFLASNHFISTSRHFAPKVQCNPKSRQYVSSRKFSRPHALFRKSCLDKGVRRGMKTLSSISVPLQHQGVLPQAAPVILEKNDGPAYPTVIQQARNNMNKFSHCVVLTRVGSFYELYFDQAKEYGPLLNIKVGKKSTNAGVVPMAGFPDFQLDRFLKVLVQDLGKHVAISEQFENDPEAKVKSGGLMHDRRVARIVTPGTLIDEKFMNPYENNYLLSVAAGNPHRGDPQTGPKKILETSDIGVAWLDLSSGDFYTQRTDVHNLGAVIARIAPREILVDPDLRDTSQSGLEFLKYNSSHTITYVRTSPISSEPQEWLDLMSGDETRHRASDFELPEIMAGNAILQYVNENLIETKPRLQIPVRRHDDEFMTLDKNTLRALEIRETIRDRSFTGSLLHTVRETVTKSGARLLNQRLASPSMNLEEINGRLDLVTELLRCPVLHENLIALLADTSDSMRLVQKFSFGRGDADDLLSLSSTIKTSEKIAQLLVEHIGSYNQDFAASLDKNSIRCKRQFDKLVHRFRLEGPGKLSARILRSIDEDRLMEVHRVEENEAASMVELANSQLDEHGEGINIQAPKGPHVQPSSVTKVNGDYFLKDCWIMKRTASPTSRRLHEALDAIKEDQSVLESQLRSKIGSTNLFLRWTPGLGHIVHVKGGAKEKAIIAGMSSARTVKASKTTQSFYLSEWTELGSSIEKARKRIAGEEDRIFSELRALVVRNLVDLRRNASILDELDVACSFATLARKHRLVRPVLHTGRGFTIVGGRHPTVENGLAKQGRQFTANDLRMSNAERILLITGPNMGGKSTYLRQNALIAILAQTGSYVPAEYAELGLVDKIFSRVGSADNLYEDQSTFMVEMLETAQILKQATPRSFVIMDEVGRGTTPEDGVAVGFTALHHLYHVNKSRVLFATHFHALTDMVKGAEGISCYCTDVAEDREDGSWMFVHKLRSGVNRDSHALKVAKLAGMPDESVAVAANVLEHLRASHVRPEATPPMIHEPLVDRCSTG